MSVDGKTPMSGDSSESARDLRMRGTKPVDFSKPLDLSVLKGKTALITGGASGLGYGMTAALASHGAFVAMCDLNAETGLQAEKDFQAQGYNVKFIPTDVTSFQSQLSAFKTTLASSPTGTIDIVIPNAGLTHHPITAYTTPTPSDPDADPPEPNTATLDVNSTGVYYSTTLALFHFTRQAQSQQPSQNQNRLDPANIEETSQPSFRPQLLFVSSLAGYIELPLSSDYNASKFAARGLWKSVRHHAWGAVEGGGGSSGGGAQVNLLAPTYVRTPMVGPFADVLEGNGIRVAEVADVVAGALRAVCDGGVEARAIAIAKGREEPGDMNFDLLDDPVDFDGGKAFLEARLDGRMGAL